MAAAGPGSVLLLDDGKVRLEVTRQTAEHLETRVIVGGRLSDHKGVNLPGLVLPIPALTTKDRSDLGFALEHGCDYIGLSFVQRPEDVMEARELVAGRAFILSKIEKPGALQSIDEVMRLSDAIMVARGDLGVEMPAEEVPLIQKRLIRAAHRHGRPVVVATQMMESMIENPTPTRAEASDVATAVFDGADAVMLSAESATGKYPVETVRMMDRIIARTEEDDEARATRRTQRPNPEKSSADAICAAAGQVAEIIDAKAIAAFSLGGNILLKMLGELAERPGQTLVDLPRISLAVAVAPPADLHSCSLNMERMSRLPYTRYYLKLLEKQVRARASRWEAWRAITPKVTVRTIRQFDDWYTAPLAGYADTDDYYTRASSSRWFDKINVPTRLLIDEHDPIIPFSAFRQRTFSPSVVIEMTRFGGHLGYLARDARGGTKRWLDKWIDHILNQAFYG